jgi:hypothetical protein
LQRNNAAKRYLTVQGEWAMDDIVERVIASCEHWERLGREEVKVKVGQYLEKLSSAGHRDVEELTYYGLAYLRILHETRAAERPLSQAPPFGTP